MTPPLPSSQPSGRRVLLAHHFFHPDDVVSARLFTDLGLGLQRRGWDVTALTCNRSWANPRANLPRHDRLDGMAIERTYRPPWGQARPVERLANSAWMMAAWTARIARMKPFDVVLLGSDPAFAAAGLAAWRRLWPYALLVHWCYDVYPEAILADGAGRTVSAVASVARRLMAAGYRSCDVLVDLGPGMRERLAAYETSALRATIPPWALVEPELATRAPDPRVREQLFGPAKIGILYSGTLGRAHDFQALLDLARASRSRGGDSIGVCFSCRGHRLAELESALRPEDTNVRLAPFCSEAELEARLQAADLHAVSLQPEWAGIVVPSKFFGSLAAGRPVIYAGPAGSDVAQWIASLRVGFDLTPETTVATVDALHRLAASPDDLAELQRRARRAYDERFSMAIGIDAWDRMLRAHVGGSRTAKD